MRLLTCRKCGGDIQVFASQVKEALKHYHLNCYTEPLLFEARAEGRRALLAEQEVVRKQEALRERAENEARVKIMREREAERAAVLAAAGAAEKSVRDRLARQAAEAAEAVAVRNGRTPAAQTVAAATGARLIEIEPEDGEAYAAEKKHKADEAAALEARESAKVKPASPALVPTPTKSDRFALLELE